MIEELQTELRAYNARWDTLVGARNEQPFFKAMRPVAVGWKVADPAQYERWRLELHAHSVQIVETWMNGRWIAKCLLRDPALLGGIAIVKIMQRRPASKDAVGLDHVDFYCNEPPADIEMALKAETDLQWTRESNDSIDNYEWLSLWFDGTEAKLKNYTVLDILMAEFAQSNRAIIGPAAKAQAS